MTEVLLVPRQPDGQSYYHTSALRPSTPSSSSLFLDAPHPKSSITPPAEHQEHQKQPSSPPVSISQPPSTSSSFSTLSDATQYSTSEGAGSNLTLDTDIDFPNYDSSTQSTGVPPSSPACGEDSSDEPAESTTTETTLSDSPLPTPTVADDTAVKQEPSRQVDFLSHEWREEDIWSSWRHIVSQRRALGERSRLENASWRSWAKSRSNLKTFPPERLNWLKESDVTWLYGPLKLAKSYPITQVVSEPDSQISKNNSFISKKPILKKRSVSEAMLQKSLSTSSLIKQAATKAQADHSRRSGSYPEVIDSKLQSETPSRDQVDYFTSRSTSSGGTPCETHEKRHIRFDDRVEQCIAVDCKETGVDEEDESEDEQNRPGSPGSDSSSDEGIVMMKRKKRPSSKKKALGSRSNSANGRKSIETLPSTTLKYRTDSPDIPDVAQHHTFGRSWSSGNLSPSPSQETLRPTHPSSNFLLPNDDEDEDGDDVDSDSSWSFGANNPKSSLGASISPSGRRERSSTPGFGPRNGDYEMEGMRRTPSGMFMPYDEDEDDAVAAGLFGRVSETINTAKDIAHVIWNVGWRK